MSSRSCPGCKKDKKKYEDRARERQARAKKANATGKKANIKHSRDERFETKFTKRYGKDGKECSFDFDWTGSHSETFSADMSANSSDFNSSTSSSKKQANEKKQKENRRRSRDERKKKDRR